MLEFNTPEILGEEICRVVTAIYEEYFHKTTFDDFTYVVISDVDVFRVFAGNRIRGHEYGTLVIPSNRNSVKLIS